LNVELVADKIIEALVLLEEKTRAIGERLKHIEARLKELDREESEKSLEEAVTRRVQTLPQGYNARWGEPS
jgi:hypothetical protein